MKTGGLGQVKKRKTTIHSIHNWFCPWYSKKICWMWHDCISSLHQKQFLCFYAVQSQLCYTIWKPYWANCFLLFGSNAHQDNGHHQLCTTTTEPIPSFSWCLTFTITRAHNLPCPTYSCTVTSTTTTPFVPPLPPQQQIPFEEYSPDTTSYSLPQNNKRKKYTPTKVDDYHHESNTKQV